MVFKQSQAHEAQNERGRYQPRSREVIQSRVDSQLGAHFFPIPLTSTTFWRVLMAFSRTGSTDCMIPSLLSISLIYGCIPSMAFIFLATSTSGCPSSSLLRILAVRAFWMFLMAAVLATAASASPLASLIWAEERVDSS